MRVFVGFTRETEPDYVSRKIMSFLNTDYSHVFFILEGKIFHSTGEGVNFKDLRQYLEDHVLVKSFPVELDISEEAFLAYMDGAKGKEYGHAQYLGFVFPALKALAANGDEKLICSELVAIVLEKYGGLSLPKDADFMSPRDVYELLEKQKVPT